MTAGGPGGQQDFKRDFSPPGFSSPAQEENEEVTVCFYQTDLRGRKTHRTVSRANGFLKFSYMIICHWHLKKKKKISWLS